MAIYLLGKMTIPAIFEELEVTTIYKQYEDETRPLEKLRHHLTLNNSKQRVIFSQNRYQAMIKYDWQQTGLDFVRYAEQIVHLGRKHD